MAQFDLYIDTGNGSLVLGPTSAAGGTLPPFVQGDTLNLRIWLLARAANFPYGVPPFSIINNAGLTLQVAIGDKVGNATNYYATQFVWTPDAQNQYFTAQLGLNTVAITNLIGSQPSASTTLHVEYLSAGLPTTVLEIPVTIQAAVIKPGGAGPLPPGQTPLSAEYANATFLTRNIVGAAIFQNPNTGKKVAVYVDDDGAFKMDPVN